MNDTKYEIERKFLIEMPDIEELKRMPGCIVKYIEQTYLCCADGLTARVRKIVSEQGTEYVKTVKERITGEKCIETENKISVQQYQEELKNADTTRNTIVKTRYCIPHGELFAEIDIYPFWKKCAIAEFEIEREGQQFFVPDYIRVIKDVTFDVEFKNFRLAQEIPQGIE